MAYKIVGDSCMDLPDKLKKDRHFVNVPLTIQLGSKQFIDDASFNQKDFFTHLKGFSRNPLTACPSPSKYLEAYQSDAENIFVVTLSSALSGSYNSALLAKRLYEEQNGTKAKKIAVVDSESASAGESKIALFIHQLCEQNFSFEEIKSRAINLRNEMKTYFVLENLDFLRKSGRLSGLKDILVNVLNIKFVMGSEKGRIKKIIQDRGINKTLQRMCQTVAAEVDNIKDKVLVISHINNPERAEYVKGLIKKHCICKDIVIVNGGGISTVYAGNGGIILAV